MSTRVKTAVVVAIAAGLTALAAPAGAHQRPAQVYRAMNVETPPAGAPRVVMPCEQGVIARRAFERRFGEAQVFVTAQEALAARDRGETWSAPRCMTQREHTRLSNMLS